MVLIPAGQKLCFSKTFSKCSHRSSMGNLSETVFSLFPFVIPSKGGLNFASQVPKATRVLSLMLLVCFSSQELTKLLHGETGSIWDVKTRSQPISGSVEITKTGPSASCVLSQEHPDHAVILVLLLSEERTAEKLGDNPNKCYKAARTIVNSAGYKIALS